MNMKGKEHPRIQTLVAALENALGAARNETAEQRLQRAIDMAKGHAPLNLGSFAQFAEP
jgi:hypothetical protein